MKLFKKSILISMIALSTISLTNAGCLNSYLELSHKINNDIKDRKIIQAFSLGTVAMAATVGESSTMMIAGASAGAISVSNKFSEDKIENYLKVSEILTSAHYGVFSSLSIQAVKDIRATNNLSEELTNEEILLMIADSDLKEFYCLNGIVAYEEFIQITSKHLYQDIN